MLFENCLLSSSRDHPKMGHFLKNVPKKLRLFKRNLRVFNDNESDAENEQ